MATIGERAAMAIKERAWANGTSFLTECIKTGVCDCQMRHWATNGVNPNANALAEMYRNGYDVIYILTGEKHE